MWWPKPLRSPEFPTHEKERLGKISAGMCFPLNSCVVEVIKVKEPRQYTHIKLALCRNPVAAGKLNLDPSRRSGG
jgi:hypothetical protein